MSEKRVPLKPFDVIVTVHFAPSTHEWAYGYDVTASGYSHINDSRVIVEASPQITYTHGASLVESFNVYVNIAQVAQTLSKVLERTDP